MVCSDEEIFQCVEEVMRPFDISLKGYDQICKAMNDAMSLGLKESTHTQSSLQMLPTYVTNIPNGSEKGHFLALDLGGTNYRVLSILLRGKDSPPKLEERSYSVPLNKMTGSGAELFKYIAETLANFLEAHGLQETECKLGFTFSFPCDQKGLTHATLLRWTKGFNASDTVGKNVAALLQEAVDKMGVKVKCVAVVNDTVGTLASCALEDSRCAIGLIVGTGTNAAYIEDAKLVELMTHNEAPEVVVNTEWGAFGEKGELDNWLTLFDKSVDAESLHPGEHIFEKMTSGMYLGELTRHILLYLAQKKILFCGQVPERLLNKNSLLTKYLTDVERDPPHLFYNAHYMLAEDLKVPVVEPIDAKIVRYVCEKVTTRAAYLIGTGIACILRRMKRDEVTVGVDGSLYKFHPKFCERMTDMVDKLKPEKTMFCLRLSEDGSGKGAAAIAAAAGP